MKNNILKSLLAMGTVFVMTGCGGSSSPVDDVASDLVDSIAGSAEETVTSAADITISDVSDVPIELADSIAGSAEETVTSIADITISDLPVEIQDAIDEPKSILTQDLKDAITFMYNEEGLAYDVYMNVYKIQAVKQLQNTAQNSETKHMQSVDELAVKYDLNMTTYDPTLEPYSKEGISSGTYTVPHIQELYDLLYAKGIKSKQDALEVGCMVEVVDVEDLENYIALATESNATDVLDVFDFLITGSYKHYWTFDAGLKKMGIIGGCCSVEDEFGLGHNFCQPDYPNN